MYILLFNTKKKIKEMNNEIQHELGTISGKQTAMCTQLTRIEEKLSSLPCESHIHDCAVRSDTKVSWKVFLASIGILFTLVCASFTYTWCTNETVHKLLEKQDKDGSRERTIHDQDDSDMWGYFKSN